MAASDDRWGGAAGYPRPVKITDGRFPEPGPANPDFVVGVIDTGILPHDYLARHLTADSKDQQDHLPKSGRTLGPVHGHGTFVAGLILSEAPAATIAMRAALDKAADHGTDESVASAIRSLCAVDRLKVVNLSFFGGSEEHDPPLGIKLALRELVGAHPDIVIVTAAGNRWTNALTWPAAFNRDFDQVIAVGAVDETAVGAAPVPPRASFSNWGTRLDACAPGVDVIGPIPRYSETIGRSGRAPQKFTEWATWSGTSFAAATVSGLIVNAMIEDALSGRDAREKILRGPRVALPGIAEEHWPPYVRSRTSTWPHSEPES